MNNIMDIAFSDESIEEATCREFKALQAEICRWDLFGAQADQDVSELDRLTVELLKVVELKKIAGILAEKE